MRLSTISGGKKSAMRVTSEGVVAAARGDILNIVNELAGKVARVLNLALRNDPDLSEVKVSDANVEFANTEDQPAIVTVRIGGRTPESLAVTVYGDGDGELKMEMSERLSRLLKIPRTMSLSSLDEVIRSITDVATAMKDGLRGRA